MARKSRLSKLVLHRETLRSLAANSAGIGANRSCIESCFDMSCEGGCGISEGAATA